MRISQLVSKRAVTLWLFLGIVVTAVKPQSKSFIFDIEYSRLYYFFNKYEPGYSNNGSFFSGLNVEYKFAEKIGIGSGFGYELKDFVITYSNPLFVASENFRLEYSG